MRKFTDDELALIKFVGVEVVKTLLKAYKARKATGQELLDLLEKASNDNELTIDDIEV